MTIISLNRGNPRRADAGGCSNLGSRSPSGEQGLVDFFKIELSDGSLLFIKDYYLDSLAFSNLSAVGKEIPHEEEEALRFANACFRAERAGLRLIARAEQTQSGLYRKLKKRGYNTDCVSAVITHFVENDLVNDERYAERWLRSRLARKGGKIKGPRRLLAALGNRGISREALKGAFDKVLDEEAEFTLLQRFLTKNRIGNVPGAYSIRGRLKYEGFSSLVINRYLDETAGVNTFYFHR